MMRITKNMQEDGNGEQGMGSQVRTVTQFFTRAVAGATTASCAGIWLLLLMLIPVGSAHAQDYQYQTGSPVFSVAQPVPFGFVNLANGNPHLEIPIASAPQRGKLRFEAKWVYDGRIWQVVNAGGSLMWKPTNVPNSIAGWRFVTTGDPGAVTFDTLSDQDCAGNQNKVDFTNFVWQDPAGTRRKFNIVTAKDPGCPDDVSTGDGYALDSSGYHIFVTSYNNATVFAKDGTQVFPTVQDTNGNFFSTDGNGNVIDTLGRAVVKKTVSGNQIFYDVLNSQGTTSRFTITTSSILVNTGFSASQTGITDDQENITVVSSFGLPNGDTYTFTYDAAQPLGTSGTFTDGYGLLTSISHSTLGTIQSFNYENFIDAFGVVNRWATNTFDASVSYAVCLKTPNCQTATLTRNGDNIIYSFSMQQGGAWNTTATSGLLGVTNQYDFSQTCPGCENPVFVTLQNVRTTDSGLTSQTAYTYDSPSTANATLIQQWNYYKGDATTQPPATPDHQIAIVYSSDPNLIANHITNRVSSVTEQDGSGNQLGQVQYLYDTTKLASLSGTITNLNTGVSSHRGNLTQINLWTGGTSFLNTVLTYDSSGQVAQVTDPAGNVTKIGYADNFYNDNGKNPPTSATPSEATNAYPTSVTVPDGQISLGYYFGSGKPALATDLNSQTTYQHYADSLDRLTQVVAPQGWRQMAYTSINTVDLYAGTTDTAPSSSCTGCFHEQSTFDIFGHLAGDTLKSDPAGAVTVNYLNDMLGNVLVATNPSRASGTAPETKTFYNSLYWPTETINPDGSKTSIFYETEPDGTAPKQLCASATYGFGNSTVMVDEMGKQRQVFQDAFGRVIESDEADNTGALSVATCHQYNAAGELAQIVQGGLTRSYQYDPLGRVTQVTTPEGGTETFSYANDDGTLCSGDPSAICKRVDARGIATHYQYDTSGRLTQKTYSDGTPTAIFNYNETKALGVSLTNTVGRLSSISTQNANGALLTGEVFSYDPVGNIINNSQCTPQNCSSGVFQNSYVFDRLGNIINFNNSWGRNLAMGFNNAAQMTSVTASPSDSSHPANILANPKYNEFGALISDVLGNGLEEAYGFSKVTGRLNSARIGASTPFDVPKPGNIASPGAGSITISGAVQQTTTTGTPGSATLAISGGERQVANGTQPASPSTVTFTITGGEQVTQSIEDAATSSSGSVTINGRQQLWVKLPPQPEVDANTSFSLGGPLQSTLVGGHGATSATASVTITGIEQSRIEQIPCPAVASGSSAKAQSGPIGCNPKVVTLYNFGNVSITINGTAYSCSYGQGSSAGIVATCLAGAINGGSLAWASLSGTTISLTAKTSGGCCNYSLSVSESYDTVDFSGPSFTASTSGSALSGGSDAFAGNTVYDTGTVSISFTTYPSIDLNPKTYSATANYGNGSGQDSSALAVATDLSNQLAAQGSPVRAVASAFGSSIQFTAPSGGAGNLVTIACSSATSSPNFTKPSFVCPSQNGLHLGIFNLPLLFYDTGTVSLSVGNTTATANYGFLGSNTQWSTINLTSATSAQPDGAAVGFASSPANLLVEGVSTPPPATEHVVYMSKGHVHELRTDANGQFHDQDVTQAAGGATASREGLTAFAGNASFPEHVFYLDTNGDVHELYLDANAQWHDQDNSVMAHAPAATVNSLAHPLAGFLVSFPGAGIFPEHVFYADASSDIHELYSDSSGQWHQQDITAASRAPAFSCSLTGFYAVNSSAPAHVLFVDGNGHVQEMYADAKGFWHSQDITALTGTSATCGSSIPTFMTSFGSCGGAGEHIFFINGDLFHLWSDAGGAWHSEDVSNAVSPRVVADMGLTGFCDSNAGSPFVFASTSQESSDFAFWQDSAGWHDILLPGGGAPVGAFFDGIGGHIPFFNSNGFGIAESVSGSPANIAAALVNNAANGLNLLNSPVTPTLSGNTISLQAKTTGLSTNYPLSVTSTYQKPLFPQPSFTGANAPTMTGGLDAVSTPLYDSGTLSVIVNNHTDEVVFGLTATPQSIAAELANTINFDAGAPVSASQAGPVITLTSKATGSKTNYALAAGVLYDSADFSSPSFQATSNNSTMQGGQDANGTVWDTGTISVTVNGLTKAVPYGRTSSSTTLETAVVNAFNSDPTSAVWAAVNNGTITFTAKKPGSSTNYAITAGSATNNSNFSSTSFPVALSGATLAGGADSGGSQTTVSDLGVVSLNVGSFTAAVNYGPSSTANSGVSTVCCTAANVASALANVLNQTPNSQVIAAVNGAQLSLISSSGGAVTNYSLSASSQSNDTTDFPNPSFAFAPASGSLSGGADKPNSSLGSSSIAALALSQIGPWQSANPCDVRLDVFVNGSDYSTCIGPASGNNPFSITAFAAQVAQSINQANGLVTATASGNVVYLQSAVGGSRTNYPLQAVVNVFNPAAVSPISAAVTGPAMTGGSDNGGFVYALDLDTDPSGLIAGANDSVNGNWTYLYDNLGRLRSAFTPANGYSYTYDVYGNRLTQTPSNGGNSLSLAYVNNQISATGIQYDAAGNMIADGTHTYAYDAENRLVSVDNGQTASYLYSADGLRVRSTVGTSSTDFVHDADGETVGVLDANGSLIRQEIAGLATYTSSGAFFHHRDWLGNLRVITDQTGTIQQTCTNLPYGDALTCSSTGVTPLNFTSYMRDSESNLDFASARYYSSQFGRFMSPDPLAGDITDPQSLNRYAYVMNSPLSAIDPSGMDGCVLVDGVFNCVVTSGGGGSGLGGSGSDGGLLDDATGAFGGPLSGSLAICFFLDCGIASGGGSFALPSAPTASQLSSEMTLGNMGAGVGKELFNTVKGSADSSLVAGWFTRQIPEMEPSNSTQKRMMDATFAATLLIPGGGEEAAAAKIEGSAAARIEELTAQAKRLFPKLAKKVQDHHILPKYLGGAANGETKALNAAYHQLITNEFRRLAPYGKGIQRNAEEVQRILRRVYSKFPLPED